MKRGAFFFAAAASALVAACSSSSGSSGPSQDQACADQAKAFCTKTQQCSTYWWQVRFGGDMPTCLSREEAYCLSAAAAPNIGKTPQTTEACVSAYAGYTCPDWLANNAPAACVAHPGALANGSACAFNGQCQTSYCELPQNFACGSCAPPTKPGDSCASGGVCATETTGQYCASQAMVCTTPVAMGGACDDTMLLCVGGTDCVPIAVRTNDNTTMMRVNDVMRTRIVGASVRTVSSSRICSDIATCCGFVAGVTPMLTCGIGTTGLVGPGMVCAIAGSAQNARVIATGSASAAMRSARVIAAF